MVWMITLKKVYIDAIKAGIKSIEIRTKLPKGLLRDDTILCVEKGTKGHVVLKFEIKWVHISSAGTMWALFKRAMAIDEKVYKARLKDYTKVYGLMMEDVEILPEGINIHDFGISHVPQWFTKVKCDYKKILKHNAL